MRLFARTCNCKIVKRFDPREFSQNLTLYHSNAGLQTANKDTWEHSRLEILTPGIALQPGVRFQNFQVFGPLRGRIKGVNFSTYEEVKNFGAFIVACATQNIFLCSGVTKLLAVWTNCIKKTWDQLEKWHAYSYVILVIYVVWNNDVISWRNFAKYLISWYGVLLRHWMTHYAIVSNFFFSGDQYRCSYQTNTFRFPDMVRTYNYCLTYI